MTVMAEAAIREYRQELTAHPQDLKVLRWTVRAHLRHWGFDQLVEAATLGVNELLSNVDKHTESASCVLTLQRQPAGVRVTVSDTSTDLPVVRAPDWAAESGRGLVLLRELATSWGVKPTAEGKDVWFEIEISTTSGEPAA
ncbi:ATP-binding protein [Streptomyces botrytidirepellens]|nr:ATP-binding protein [Streptomyces botrytidirepellens]